jgi:hypothetical protein
MDISLAIKSGYFESLSYGLNIPVYDAFAIPTGVSYPYVIIAEVQVSERLPNGCEIYNANVTVDIVTGFSSPKGMNEAWNISEVVKSIIRPSNGEDINLNDKGWNVGETRLLGSNPNQFRTDNWWIYRNILQFSHIVAPY